ncbi:helix-turn-helix domain-containing protein [Hymenobacter busanensis]|uniref:helix-turn-helix domain-containing protein n=1 Tax=Hymenobacter busanensis TaxID=2607656 RepID=UPI001366D9EB|nr:helix-turn-helix transcriptional regulator [Hymenobacter busanensis]QHJ08855.1 helix-turn-helix domain-containing protein [Hymenobacter busanensis]
MKNPGGVKIFGDHLRRLREAREWSQVELADYANVSNMTVHRIETAQFAATIDVLLSLSKALQMPLHELVKCPGMEEAD